jgi:hypothetical protein
LTPGATWPVARPANSSPPGDQRTFARHPITFGGAAEEGEIVAATQYITKYAGIVVLDHFDPAVAYPLLTLRLNIYTDPQKPISVDAKLYDFNHPTPASPLLVTTNFSLTYFSVAGEIDGCGLPAWLMVCDAEGMSVLTSWAAGKFDAETIAKAVKAHGLADKLSHKKINPAWWPSCRQARRAARLGDPGRPARGRRHSGISAGLEMTRDMVRCTS